MADLEKKFRLVLDADVKGATSGLDQFGAAAKKADTATAGASKGITGSLGDIVAKTGVGKKAMDTFGLSANQMGTIVAGAAVVAGGAIAHFALSGAARFGELGKSVEAFAVVAGTTNETASRFVAVADDYGVAADTLSGAVGKLGKGLGGNAKLLDSYGVSIAYAKDGSIDLAQTTFNVIDAYNATTDPAKKAALGAAAFGKGYQALIPLIDVGSAKIKASFDDVSKAQLFDDAKIKQAKDYRLTMDTIHDSVQDLSMTAGQLLIPTLEGVGRILDSLGGHTVNTNDKSSLWYWLAHLNVIAQAGDVINLLKPVGIDVTAETDVEYYKRVSDKSMLAASNVEQLQLAMMNQRSEVKNSVATYDDQVKMTDQLIGRYKDELKVRADLTVAIENETRAALDKNNAALASQSADLNSSDAIQAYRASLVDTTLSQREHRQEFIKVQQTIDDTATKYVSYKQTLAEAAGANYSVRDAANDQITSLQNQRKELEPGSPLANAIDAHIAQIRADQKALQDAAAAAAGYVNALTGISGNAAGPGNRQAYASGGPFGPGSFTVGEDGPERITVGASGRGYVTPLKQSGAADRAAGIAARAAAAYRAPTGESAWAMQRPGGAFGFNESYTPGPSPRLSSGGGGGSAPAQIVINVDVAPTADKAAVGRVIVESLRAYENVSGRGWRA